MGSGVADAVGVTLAVGADAVCVLRAWRVALRFCVGDKVAVAVAVGVRVAVCVVVGVHVFVGRGVAVAVGVAVAANANSCVNGVFSCVQPAQPKTTAKTANKKGLRSATLCCPRFRLYTAKNCNTNQASSKSNRTDETDSILPNPVGGWQ